LISAFYYLNAVYFCTPTIRLINHNETVLMKMLLITGVTGFLGGAVLEKILTSDQSVKLLLLARASDPQSGLERVLENMRKFNVPEDKLASLSVDNILIGDLSQPEAFLNDPRLDQVTHVVNCAAVASFGNNPLIWKVNVEGTLALARRMEQVSGLQRFLHVGTAMSCTPEQDSLVAESAEFRENAEHLVEYTFSKSTIEQLMRQVSEPAAAHRPSVHRRRPYPSRLHAVEQHFLGLQHGPDAAEVYVLNGRPDRRCSGGLLRRRAVNAAQQQRASGEVVHISAGEENSVRFADIDQAMAQALEKAPSGINMRRSATKRWSECAAS
jgi:nucleoside-diphosphate-sugar epimerase